MRSAQVVSQFFLEKFPTTPRIFRAPGRVNIIGEHTDYNMGFVLPAAIDMSAWMAMAPAKGDTCRWVSVDFHEEVSLTLKDIRKVPQHWANYLLGVVQQFQILGHEVPAFDALIVADVPIGSGLSSSAALQSVVAWAINDWLGLGYSRKDLALLVQRAENRFIGLQCGIMDMFASLHGKQGHALRLDCRSLEYELFPLDLEGHRIVLFDTGVKHSLASTEYNTRRGECEAGVERIRRDHPVVHSLRDVTMDMLSWYREDLDPVIYQRCRFVIEENARVFGTCSAMQRGDLQAVGGFMSASHKGLRDDYQVSCPELDLLESMARKETGILGARMMGGGFGGCTINLVREEALESIAGRFGRAYKASTGIELKHWTVVTGDGASEANP
jgi:galactokinase